uniref:Uncharacterized protein n=1 Tax=Trichobilharzia regenti TaxID=157069 RepID=A0AA85KCV2_TRIRE|nr:unnamed protein product [Trichobilharzia regenti]
MVSVNFTHVKCNLLLCDAPRVLSKCRLADGLKTQDEQVSERKVFIRLQLSMIEYKYFPWAAVFCDIYVNSMYTSYQEST